MTPAGAAPPGHFEQIIRMAGKCPTVLDATINTFTSFFHVYPFLCSASGCVNYTFFYIYFINTHAYSNANNSHCHSYLKGCFAFNNNNQQVT